MNIGERLNAFRQKRWEHHHCLAVVFGLIESMIVDLNAEAQAVAEMSEYRLEDVWLVQRRALAKGLKFDQIDPFVRDWFGLE